MKRILFLLVLFIYSMDMMAQQHDEKKQQLLQEIQRLFSAEEGVFAFAYKDLTTGDTIFLMSGKCFMPPAP